MSLKSNKRRLQEEEEDKNNKKNNNGYFLNFYMKNQIASKFKKAKVKPT